MNIRKLAAFSGAAMLTLGAAGMVSAASVEPTSHVGNITASGTNAANCPGDSAALEIGAGVASGHLGGLTIHVTYNADNSIDFQATG